jgi:hypothetical protein
VSELEPQGLILDPTLDLAADPTPDSVPVSDGGLRGSLKEIGGWWGLLRFLPGAIRQAFSGREPAGGLPVVEPDQTRPAALSEVDFGDSFPTADHTLSAEMDPTALGAEAGAEAEAPGSEARLAGDEAELAADVAGGQYAADLALITDVGDDTAAAGAAANGHGAHPMAQATAAEAAAAEAGAELGEAGL